MDFSNSDVFIHIEQIKHLLKGLYAIADCNKDTDQVEQLQELKNDCVNFYSIAQEKLEQVYNELMQIEKEIA